MPFRGPIIQLEYVCKVGGRNRKIQIKPKKAENKAANTRKIVNGQPSVATRWHESPKEQFMGAEVDRKVRWAGRIWLDLKEQ